MRVAICQMNSGADVERNLATAERLVRQAADGGADLASLPEYLEFMGPASRRHEVAQPIPGPVTDRIGSVARSRSMWVIAGGLLEAHADHVYDTSVLIDREGEIAASYRKIHLFDVELADQPPIQESATITAGDQLVTHVTETARVGLSICYDLRFPELYRGLMAQGAEVLFVPAQFQHSTGKDHWHTLLRARAIENQCFVVAPAQCGAFGAPGEGRRSYGHSLVVDPWGRILAEGSEDGEGVWFADLDLDEMRGLRRSFPVLQHRRLGTSC
ncbi:MAG TPA: carbon-nitrogen hydrolase family protein [Actinomycetota bacterium]